VSASNKTELFKQIIEENKGILYKVISIYCKNNDDKKDLEQEILIQLWQSLKNYNDNYKLSTWVYKVAVNVSISFYRKSKQRNKTKTVPLDSIFNEKAYEEQDDGLDENRRILNLFIDQLNKFDKAILILYMEEYNYKEISEIVGISESNVGTKINRIKNKLTNSIQKQY